MRSASAVDEMPPGAEFHHIGYACQFVARDRPWFESLGFRLEGQPFVDTVQGIAGCFMVGAGPRIELLENLPGHDTLTPWLAAGTKMYHLAYEVREIDGAINWARQHRARIVVPPVPAIAFAGRRIAFAMLRNGLMLEFVERRFPEHRG